MAPHIEDLRDLVRIEHYGRLVKGLNELREDDFLSDFTIVSGDIHFPVHRVVIATASSYFKAMLASNMKEAQERSVVMQNVTPEAVEQCISFMYSGEAAIHMKNVEGIAYASSLMDLRGMQILCAKYLAKELCLENCLFIKQMAEQYVWDDLKSSADKHIITNFKTLLEMEGFVTSLRPSDLYYYLPKAECEVKWIAISKCLQGTENPDEKEVMQLLEVSNFPFLFMMNVVLQSPVVLESHSIKGCVVKQLFAVMLENEITLNNCFMLLSLSRDFSHQDVENDVMNFMLKNCNRIVLQNEFKDLDFDTVNVVLDPSNTTFSSEMTRAKGVFRWLKHKTDRTVLLPELFALIDLGQLPHQYLTSTLPSEPLLSDFPECRKHLDAFLHSSSSIEKPSCEVVADGNKVDEKLVTIGTDGGTVSLETVSILIPANAFAMTSSVSAVVYRQLWKWSLNHSHLSRQNLSKVQLRWDPVSLFLDFHLFGEMSRPAEVTINVSASKSMSPEQKVVLLCRAWDDDWNTIKLLNVENSCAKVSLSHSCCIVAAVRSSSWRELRSNYHFRKRRLQIHHMHSILRHEIVKNESILILENDIAAMMKKTAHRTQKIDSAGGSISLFGCKLTFPEGAVEESTQVLLSVDNNPDHYPEHLECVSTIFGFNPSMTFKKPVEVEIDTWFGPAEGESISALLFSRKSADLEWKNFGRVELNRSNKIKFSTSHFCEMTVCVESQDLSKGEFTVSNSVYIQQGTCMIHSSFYLDSKTENDVWQAMRRRSLATLSSRELRVVGKEEEKIEIKASTTKPKMKNIGKIVPSCMFSIEKVTKFKIYGVQLDPDFDDLDGYQGPVKGIYSVGIQGKESDFAIMSRIWPVVLDPEDKRVNQNNYGNAIATGNGTISQIMQDTKVSSRSNTAAAN